MLSITSRQAKLLPKPNCPYRMPLRPSLVAIRVAIAREAGVVVITIEIIAGAETRRMRLVPL